MVPIIRRFMVLCLILTIAVQTPAVAHGLDAAGAGKPGPSTPGAAAPGTPGPGLSQPANPDATAWYDGGIKYSIVTNCASIIQGFPYQENGVGAYVGFLADPNAAPPYPSPNNPYYIHIYVAGLGNPCSGTRLYVETTLPANTVIDSSHPIYCFYDAAPVSPASSCPQVLPASSMNPGAYVIPSQDSAHAYTWPLAQGHTLEFQIPVKSSTALTNSAFQANIWALDGNSSPWLHPQVGVYVFSSTPVILYPSPSTTLITSTYAKSSAYIYSYGLGGTAIFDLGLDIGYALKHDNITIPAGGSAWMAWDDWTPFPFTPDTLYHFRVRFAASNGQTYYGSDQTFRTLPDGQVTVGSGISSSCTQSALTSALATAKQILFNCGSSPVTITLTSAPSIVTDVIIDGGNKVTLDGGGTTNHFNVQSVGHLTLDQISLVNGVNNASCGGSIHVYGGAQLSLNGARFFNNSTSSSGGAVCVDPGGVAVIQSSLFSGNHAGTFGGAIRTYGSTSMSDTIFNANTSGTNGGAIDNTSDLLVINSTFNANTTGVRGGALNNYLGYATINGSRFSSNISSGYGGGLVNDAGTVVLQNNTFIDNAANSVGGGVRNNGTMTASGNTFTTNVSKDSGGALENFGYLTLVNNTLSANQASANGGGIYWDGGQITVTNTTINGNTAAAQGGNIYAGGLPANVILKNTIVAGGSPDNCSSTVTSHGYNLENTNTCGLAAAGDLININPNLGPLRDNGGPTFTLALTYGSPAIDAGTNSGCPAIDQRGVLRPKGLRCDIGSYEYSASSIYLPMIKR